MYQCLFFSAFYKVSSERKVAVSPGERQREKLSPDKKNGSLINNRLSRHREQERGRRPL